MAVLLAKFLWGRGGGGGGGQLLGLIFAGYVPLVYYSLFCGQI